MRTAWPGFMFVDENPDGTWPDPVGEWGPYVDVNYDGKILAGDLFEINVHYVPGVESWPPPYYE